MELSLLLAACSGFSFVLHSYTDSKPTLISGTVVNAISGRPVPGVTVCRENLNSSEVLAESDAQGRFTAAVVKPGELYFLYGEDSRFGPLIQAHFGPLVTVLSRGEQHTGLVIPVVPSTELSGHVYSEEKIPLKGCKVSALTGDPKHSGNLAEVGDEETNAEGAYSFTNLGADVYLLRVQCRHFLHGERDGFISDSAPWPPRTSWEQSLWPQASSPVQAKAITLLPGDHKENIDFYLRATIQYSIRGKVVLSDGSALSYNMLSPDSMQIAPVGTKCDHFSPVCESCGWIGYDGHFHCDFLSPGLYTIHLQLRGDPLYDEGRNEEISQEAALQLEVKAGDQKRRSLTVTAHERRSKVIVPAAVPETGLLKVQRICPPGMEGGWTIAVMAYGVTTQYLRSGSSGCSEEEVWPLPVGNYRALAFEWNFSARRIDKLSPLLAQHATRITIAHNHTVNLSLKVLSKEEIFQLALAHLRDPHEPEHHCPEQSG